MSQNGIFKLDLKDRKILYELDSDARQSNSQIAKKVGLSQEVVHYRIRRLEEAEIITHYQMIANLSALGILQFKICFDLQHISSEKLNEIVGKLRKNNSVKWIVSCRGNWDLLISLETDSLEKMDSFKDEILNLFAGHINKKAISILIEASTYGREYLVEEKKHARKERIIMKESGKIKLDEFDLKILKQLGENARKPIVDIAHEIKSTERVVNYRIKQMIKKKVILGFKIAINYEKLGIHFYKTFIYLDSPSADEIKQFVSYFESQKNIIHHVRVLGNWDFEPEFETHSEKEFNEILTEMKDRFSKIIKSVEILTISKEHKFVYF